MTDFAIAVYSLMSPGVMWFMCWLVALINIWQSRNGYHHKKIQKQIKSLNWLIFGTVYFYEWMFAPPIADTKVFYRIGIGLIVLGELAYHSDTLLDIFAVPWNKARRKRHG